MAEHQDRLPVPQRGVPGSLCARGHGSRSIHLDDSGLWWLLLQDCSVTAFMFQRLSMKCHVFALKYHDVGEGS